MCPGLYEFEVKDTIYALAALIYGGCAPYVLIETLDGRIASFRSALAATYTSA